MLSRIMNASRGLCAEAINTARYTFHALVTLRCEESCTIYEIVRVNTEYRPFGIFHNKAFAFKSLRYRKRKFDTTAEEDIPVTYL